MNEISRKPAHTVTELASARFSTRNRRAGSTPGTGETHIQIQRKQTPGWLLGSSCETTVMSVVITGMFLETTVIFVVNIVVFLGATVMSTGGTVVFTGATVRCS